MYCDIQYCFARLKLLSSSTAAYQQIIKKFSTKQKFSLPLPWYSTAHKQLKCHRQVRGIREALTSEGVSYVSHLRVMCPRRLGPRLAYRSMLAHDRVRAYSQTLECIERRSQNMKNCFVTLANYKLTVCFALGRQGISTAGQASDGRRIATVGGQRW